MGMKERSIITTTYISGIGHKVSQIRTTNDYLILYLLGRQKNSTTFTKDSTVIDIDRENKVIIIKKNAKWRVVSENFGGNKDLPFTEQILKTDEEWCKDVANRI
jgi:hypothetical protein